MTRLTWRNGNWNTAQPGVGAHVLRAPQDMRLFLLSPLPPQALRWRYLLWSLLHLGACLSAAFMAAHLLLIS